MGAGGLRFGLIGLGAAGRQAAAALRQVDGCVLAAAAESDPAVRRRYQAEWGIPVFDDARELCRSAAIDAVYVATPNALHAPHALLAAAGGKHVVVEKPMATSIADCEAMIAAAEAAGVQLMVAHTRSLNPGIRAMRRIVAAGRLGRVIQILTLHYSPWLARPRLAAELRAEEGGGICYRQAPHQMDTVRLLAGGVGLSLRGSLGGAQPAGAGAGQVDGCYSAWMSFAGGVTATVSYNGHGFFDAAELTWGIGGGGTPRVPGAGRRLRALVAAGATKESWRSGEAQAVEAGGAGGAGAGGAGAGAAEAGRRQAFFGLTIVSCERGDVRQSPDGVLVYDGDGVREVPCDPWRGPLVLDLSLFRAAMAAGQPVPHDGRWGMATLEACLALEESHRLGREVALVRQVPSPY